MLYIVLALVLAAFGLLIAALTTANTIWAWVSVTISVVAAAMLIADWVSARRRRDSTSGAADTTRAESMTESMAESRAGSTAATGTAPGTAAGSTATGLAPAHLTATGLTPVVEDTSAKVAATTRASFPAGPPPDQVEPESAAEQTIQQPAVRDPGPPPPDQEPGEEQTDAADLLVVTDLTAEVRVVDEHPRYHLATCGWLTDKPTLPLPVNEARQLGFTPCAHCGPDAILAARQRAAR